jgi:hypothetical protein
VKSQHLTNEFVSIKSAPCCSVIRNAYTVINPLLKDILYRCMNLTFFSFIMVWIWPFFSTGLLVFFHLLGTRVRDILLGGIYFRSSDSGAVPFSFFKTKQLCSTSESKNISASILCLVGEIRAEPFYIRLVLGILVLLASHILTCPSWHPSPARLPHPDVPVVDPKREHSN